MGTTAAGLAMLGLSLALVSARRASCPYRSVVAYTDGGETKQVAGRRFCHAPAAWASRG